MTAHSSEDAGKGVGGTHPLLVEVQTCTTTMEISVAVPWEAGNSSPSTSSYITLGHISKGLCSNDLASN